MLATGRTTGPSCEVSEVRDPRINEVGVTDVPDFGRTVRKKVPKVSLVQKEPTGFAILRLMLRNLELLDHHGSDLETFPVDRTEDLKLEALDVERKESDIFDVEERKVVTEGTAGHHIAAAQPATARGSQCKLPPGNA